MYTSKPMTTALALRRLAAMVSPRGWLYRDAHYLVAEVELDRRAARRFVPWPLAIADPPRAQVFTGFFPTNTFGSVYREAGVFIDVRHGRTRAIHCPWMLVDDDVALIVGRELLGYPKKLGELTWEHDGDRIRGVACRRGHKLIEMTGTLGERIAAPPPILGRPHRNLRSTTGVALPKLIAFTPREQVVEVRRAELDVTIEGSVRDPLHEMGLGRVLECRLHRVDLGGARPPLPVGLVSPLTYARLLLLRSH
jgi:acetoacetate decarboxylase